MQGRDWMKLAARYYKHNLHFKRSRFKKLALVEDIIKLERKINNYWLTNGSILNKQSLTKKNWSTKVTVAKFSIITVKVTF